MYKILVVKSKINLRRQFFIDGDSKSQLTPIQYYVSCNRLRLLCVIASVIKANAM